MDQLELEQEVTENLLYALELSKYPPAAMLYCRKAIECIVHNKYYQETGEKINEEKRGRFPSLIDITEKMNKMIGKQSRLIIGSINAQSRGSLHWDFETRGNAADFEDVKLVIEQIKSVYYKFFNQEIPTLEGMEISDDDLAENFKQVIDTELTNQGITRDSNFSPSDEVNEEKLETILNLAEMAIEKGVEFNQLEFFLLGNTGYRKGDLDIAKGYYMQIKNISEESEDFSLVSDALNNLANISLRKKEFLDAEKLYKESLSIRVSLEDKLGEANALNNLGNLNMEKNNFEEAEKYFSRALEIYTLLEDLEGKGTLLHNLGRLYSKLGEKERAEKLYKSSLEIKRTLGDDTEAETLNNLGILALDRGELEKAENLLLKSLAVIQKIGDRIAEALLMNNLGLLSEKKGEVNSALKFFEVSLNIYTQIGLKSEIAGCLRHIAVLYFQEEKFDEAEKIFKQNLVIVKDLKEIKYIAMTLNNLGEIERKRKNFDEAKKLFQESLIIKEQNKDIPGLPNTYNNLAAVHYQEKDIVNAKRLFNKSLENNMQYQDSLTTKKRLEGTDRRDATHALNCLSEIAVIEGDFNKMKELIKETYLLIEGLDNNFEEEDYEKIIEILKSNMETAWI